MEKVGLEIVPLMAVAAVNFLVESNVTSCTMSTVSQLASIENPFVLTFVFVGRLKPYVTYNSITFSDDTSSLSTS